jgi:hypothetical protein
VCRQVKCSRSADVAVRVAAGAAAATGAPGSRRRHDVRRARATVSAHVSSQPFELDALLTMASVAPRDLVKTLMEIDWAPAVDDKVAQIDARLAAVRGVEAAARQRIVESPELGGKPLPPVPPAAVMREFTVVMAARTAIDKLTATRTALARKR